MFYIFALLIAEACPIPASVTKQPVPIMLSTENWPGFTNADYSGAYFDLVNLLLPKQQFALKVRFTIFSRALYDIEQKSADIALAISIADSKKDILLSANPMDQDRIVALYNPGRFTITNIDDLRELRLAWNLAYDYGRILDIDSKGYEVINTQQGIDLVDKNRVDAYLAELSLLQNYDRKIKLLSLTWKPISTDNVYVGFADNDKGRYLKCYWDNAFNAALENGSLQKLYESYPDMFLSINKQP